MLFAKCVGFIGGYLLAGLIFVVPTVLLSFLFDRVYSFLKLQRYKKLYPHIVRCNQSCSKCKYLIDCYCSVNEELKNELTTSIKNIPQE